MVSKKSTSLLFITLFSLSIGSSVFAAEDWDRAPKGAYDEEAIGMLLIKRGVAVLAIPIIANYIVPVFKSGILSKVNHWLFADKEKEALQKRMVIAQVIQQEAQAKQLTAQAQQNAIVSSHLLQNSEQQQAFVALQLTQAKQALEEKNIQFEANKVVMRNAKQQEIVELQAKLEKTETQEEKEEILRRIMVVKKEEQELYQ